MMRFRSAITGRWVSRLFAKKNPDTTVSEATTTSSTSNAIYIHNDPPVPQCQFCGYEVTWETMVCPNCGSELDEGQNGVPA